MQFLFPRSIIFFSQLFLFQTPKCSKTRNGSCSIWDQLGSEFFLKLGTGPIKNRTQTPWGNPKWPLDHYKLFIVMNIRNFFSRLKKKLLTVWSQQFMIREASQLSGERDTSRDGRPRHPVSFDLFVSHWTLFVVILAGSPRKPRTFSYHTFHLLLLITKLARSRFIVIYSNVS